jgi:anti-sigma factor RsiW
MAGEPNMTPDWPTLNAYVDGELDIEQRAQVAAAIAADGELALQVASLARLRAATAEAFAAEATAIDAPTLPRAMPRPAWRRWPAMAAAALLAVSIAVAWWSLPGGADPALQAHLRWAASPAEGVVTATRRGTVDIPDLSDAGLRVALVRAEGNALHIGYLGSRGCRVSLWVAPDDAVRPRRDERQGETLIARWAEGGLGYAAIATGMPTARFAAIAAGLEQATLNRRLPDPATRLALQSGRDQSAPCLG